jgi:hypothetical protein
MNGYFCDTFAVIVLPSLYYLEFSSCVVNYSVLKMKAVGSSKMLVNIYQTTHFVSPKTMVFIVTAVRTSDFTIITYNCV